MSTWLQAHRAANLVAAQAHDDLGVDPSRFPVDVYAAITTAGVKLMWQPLPRAFGLYLNPVRSRPGILLNNRVDLAVQRHTAAHELGHHLLGHGSRVDVDLDPFTTTRRGWTDEEKAAEAFAVWFLMPRRALRSAMQALNLTRLRDPEEVYQISLLLGTSYQSTARHLPNTRLCTPQQSRAWMAVPPGRLKKRLDPGVAPPSRAPDVWRINQRLAGRLLSVRVGDRLVIDTGSTAPVAAPVVGVTTDAAAPIAVRTVSRRERRRPLEGEPWPVTGRCLTLEVSPDTHDAAEGAESLEVRVGTRDDPNSWTFHVAVERTRRGPHREPEPRPDGPRHTITLTATEEDPS